MSILLNNSSLPNTAVFDRPEYFESLSWLGCPKSVGSVAWIQRPVRGCAEDARGSWPYQSLPRLQALESVEALSDSDSNIGAPLTWTAVIRPDTLVGGLNTPVLDGIRERYTTHWQRLKPHLCHRPDLKSARESYSRRTRRRLEQARRTFSVECMQVNQLHDQLALWQNELRTTRGIPRSSSPDYLHFQKLAQLHLARPDDMKLITLRCANSGHHVGALLLLHGGTEPASWHAHSALCTPKARDNFGPMLLFDSALDVLAGTAIWWGGQPASPSGNGVFKFKQRFSNFSSHSHLLSVDLRPDTLTGLRASCKLYDWLPNYRNPLEEMQL